MRRTKAAQIYKKTGNLRAVQLLLGHTKLQSTVRYLGIEVDDALDISEQAEVSADTGCDPVPIARAAAPAGSCRLGQLGAGSGHRESPVEVSALFHANSQMRLQSDPVLAMSLISDGVTLACAWVRPSLNASVAKRPRPANRSRVVRRRR